jgi:hypothetical protein
MNTTRIFLLGLIASLAATITAHAQSPAGLWQTNTNGYSGTMMLSVDTAGNVTGWIQGAGIYNPVKGFWNATARKLTIYRTIDGTVANTPPERLQTFTGYMFPASVSQPAGVQQLAGYFEAFAGTGGSAPRNVFGWYAVKYVQI